MCILINGTWYIISHQHLAPSLRQLHYAFSHASTAMKLRRSWATPMRWTDCLNGMTFSVSFKNGYYAGWLFMLKPSRRGIAQPTMRGYFNRKKPVNFIPTASQRKGMIVGNLMRTSPCRRVFVYTHPRRLSWDKFYVGSNQNTFTIHESSASIVRATVKYQTTVSGRRDDIFCAWGHRRLSTPIGDLTN